MPLPMSPRSRDRCAPTSSSPSACRGGGTRMCSARPRRLGKRYEPDSLMSRLAARFAQLKKEGRAAFVPFISAGDPDFETSLAIFERLPGAGADVIELGMPF